MVIVHRFKQLFPTDSDEGRRIELPVNIEYLPKYESFRISLPEHMRERLGKDEVTGNSAESCRNKLQNMIREFRKTFIKPRVVKKCLKCVFTTSQSGGESHKFSSNRIYINFYYTTVYFCQLESDPLDEDTWVSCNSIGGISSQSEIENRINLKDAGNNQSTIIRYIEWTEEREEFFIDMVEEFNKIKQKMMDFFGTEEFQFLIDNHTPHNLLSEPEAI